MCLRLKENYSFLIIVSNLRFLVLSIFPNPWNATRGLLIWNFCVAASGRTLVWTGRPSPEKHEKCPWPRSKHIFQKICLWHTPRAFFCAIEQHIPIVSVKFQICFGIAFFYTLIFNFFCLKMTKLSHFLKSLFLAFVGGRPAAVSSIVSSLNYHILKTKLYLFSIQKNV